MRSLLRYLLKNYAFLLFLLLEVVSLILIFNNNSFQRAKYLNSSNRITGSIYNSYSSITNYFGLARVNKELSEENAMLRSQLKSTPLISTDSVIVKELFEGDSVFNFNSARVINNSVYRQYNYITLNKGRKHGVKPDQGIINSEGVVGIVTNVSESYSVGFSILNKRWGVSAKHKKSGAFGPISWDGGDYRHVNLNGIPFHIQLAVGDTIVTSGYSSVFPEGVMLGTVTEFEKPPGENYYKIKVELSVDFKKLSYVEVIDNTKKEEIKLLESILLDDPVTN
ncbi:MAG: rod shape-determining protein MreC [Prolixibacteraceae bacterium]|nr:rod shape-determining protein MreC [Prolixibacteraceae bacterium]